jgi:CubicO group peptidase (beta-lactamase class C family)
MVYWVYNLKINGKLFSQVILIFLIILSISCVSGKAEQKKVKNNYNFHKLEELIKKENIDASVIMYKGVIIWDYYADGWTSEMIHSINSCTKSIVSILIGILFDQKLLNDIDIPVYTLFPNINPENLKEANKKITLKHFLTMTTGLASRDSYLYDREGLREIWFKENWINEILLLPVESSGGSRFEYSNLASFLLGEVIRSKTGKDISLYAKEKLFTPLDIGLYHWTSNIYDQSWGWAGLYLRPVDLAKIGQLILQKGEWDGAQIVSREWIKESTKAYIRTDIERKSYAYQWWIDDGGWVMAIGDEGQYLIINPELDLVVVFFSKLEEHEFFVPYQIYINYIIPEFEIATQP